MPNPYLPPETLDYITDLLHDESETLKECCLVSKSWGSRTRRHLFAHVQFSSAYRLDSWKTVFPDPANSPAYHTHTLSIGCVQFIEKADAEEGGWIQTFSRLEQLIVNCPWMNFDPTEISLAPFHKFSSTLKSLHVTSLLLPLSQIFSLIYSLPLLEDLSLIGRDTSAVDDDKLDAPSTIVPQTSPPFTGTLKLPLYLGMTNTARRLLDLPNGLHFRKLEFSWHDTVLQWMVRLVVACSDTLECLDVTYYPDGEPGPGPIDLSKALKLKKIVFQCRHLSNKWVATTLETITPQHRDLQQITICPDTWDRSVREDGDAVEQTEDTNPGTQWLDVDRLLVKFWDSRLIRPKVVYLPKVANEDKETRDRVLNLFPESKKRGIIDQVDYSSENW